MVQPTVRRGADASTSLATSMSTSLATACAGDGDDLRAAMQTELLNKREAVAREIAAAEAERAALLQQREQLMASLARLNDRLTRRVSHRAELDACLHEVEMAHSKLHESEETLLSALQASERARRGVLPRQI